MGDIKLFQLNKKTVDELPGSSVSVEKSLQDLIEKNMEAFLGVKFLATEYSTGKTHRGRIDSLGIDENGCPVIIEYKRSINENVINQGLFYLDWLMDHKAEFKLLVMEKLDNKVAANIEWSSPRLLCIAGDFTRYDEHAVQQINRNIELIRYLKFGDDLLLLELVNVTSSEEVKTSGIPKGKKVKQSENTILDYISELDGELLDRFEAIKAFILALGDDVQMMSMAG